MFIRLIYWTRYRHSKTPNTGCGNPHFQFFLKSSILFNNGLNTVSLDDVINNGFLLLEWRFLALRFFPPHLGWGGYAYYVTLFVLLKQSKRFFPPNITVTAISLLVRRYLRSFNYVMAHKKRKNERTKKNNIYITRNETMVHQVFYYTTILNFPGVVREANLWTFEPTIWWNSHQQSAVSGLTKATCLCTVTTSLEIIITTINYWFSVLVNLCFVLSSCLFTLFNLSGTELIINKTVKRWQWDETSTLDIVVNKRKWLSNKLSTSWFITEKL